MPALTTGEIRSRLRNQLPSWFDTQDAIQRKFRFTTFSESILFVNKVAAESEKKQHHPDMCINYSTVGVVLTTNSVGGVTDADFDLARTIDEIATSVPGYQAGRARTIAAA